MPETFGRYELQELLGRGGMGEVYRAYDSVRDREVALKLLPPHLASDEAFQARFRRESRLAARLNDPHIIPIHDFGEIDGRLFLDMRLVKGHDLSSTLQSRGALPLETAVGIVGQVASALDAAHESGLIHRDVKPSNILLTGSDDANPFAYLVDFGIARTDAQEGTALTATTATLGTIAYLSPERINGNPGDKRTDVYALACVLFETLTGHKPFDGEMFAMMYSHVNTPPPSVSQANPACPPAMDAVIRRGMAKNPDDRYPSAGALAREARAALRSAAIVVAPTPTPPAPAQTPAQTPPATERPAQALPPPSAPHNSGGFNSGAPYGRGSDRPFGPSGPIATPRPPGPPPAGPGTVRPLAPDQPPRGRKNRRRAVLAAVAAVVVLAGGVTAFVLVRSGDSKRTAGPGTNSASLSHSPDFPSSSAGKSGGTAVATLNVATGSQVSWKDFSSFASLLGTSDNDTSHAFQGASCTITKATSEDITGVVERVGCTVPSSSAVVSVSRFTDASTVRSYLARLQTDGLYSALPWGQQGKARGLSYLSPSKDGVPNITTTVCAMPTYLVQIYNSGAVAIPVDELRSEVWNKATFPDVIPPACADDFGGPGPDNTTVSGIVADKPGVAFSASSLSAFLTHGDAQLASTTATKGSDSETAVYDQSGHVTFWAFTADRGVTLVGSSTYPYDKSIGPPAATIPQAAYLTGMSHATFVLDGTFTTDGSGNAVAFATSPGLDWGTIKAKSNGNLAPSGQPVTSNRIGLSQGFGLSEGRLVTYDCSSQLPISQCSGNNRVIKYWNWNGNEFVQSGSAGRSK